MEGSGPTNADEQWPACPSISLVQAAEAGVGRSAGRTHHEALGSLTYASPPPPHHIEARRGSARRREDGGVCAESSRPPLQCSAGEEEDDVQRGEWPCDGPAAPLTRLAEDDVRKHARNTNASGRWSLAYPALCLSCAVVPWHALPCPALLLPGM
jgi:hypothetical protein